MHDFWKTSFTLNNIHCTSRWQSCIPQVDRIVYRYPFKRAKERYSEIISSYEHGDDYINMKKKKY